MSGADSSHSDRDVLPLIEQCPSGAWVSAGKRDIVKFIHFVQSVDANPKARPVLHYVATARVLVELVGSALVEDFSDASIKEAMAARLAGIGSVPFSGEGGGGGEWATWAVTPAHRALAFRAQAKAQAGQCLVGTATEGRPAGTVARKAEASAGAAQPVSVSDKGLQSAVSDFVAASRAQLEKDKRVECLSFGLQVACVRPKGRGRSGGAARAHAWRRSASGSAVSAYFRPMACRRKRPWCASSGWRRPPRPRAASTSGVLKERTFKRTSSRRGAARQSSTWSGGAHRGGKRVRPLAHRLRCEHAVRCQVLAGGSIAERAHEANLAKRAAAAAERLDFASYAEFQAGWTAACTCSLRAARAGHRRTCSSGACGA